MQGRGWLVRKGMLTPAKVYESEVADALVSAVTRWRCTVTAPMSPTGGVGGSRLMGSTIGSCTVQPELPHWQKRRNALIRPRRALVEKVFGTLKRSYGYSRVRTGVYVEMWFLMAYNLRRMTKLADCAA